MPATDLTDDFEFREFAAGHFDVDFVEGEIKKSREHGTIDARPHGAGFVVSETQMSREPALANNRRDRAIENVDETTRIFAMRITAHRRFIDGDFTTAGGDELGELLLDD